MALPDKVSLLQVSPTMVQVSGWASDPFTMTEASAQKSLERVRARRASYSAVEFEKHLSLYTEVFKLMGWEIPEDKSAPPPEPTPPAPQVVPVVPVVPSAPPVEPTPVVEPPVQGEQFFSTPEAPKEEPFPIDTGKTWVEQMVDEQAKAQ